MLYIYLVSFRFVSFYCTRSYSLVIFSYVLIASVVRGVSEKEGLKLQRKKLRAIIASSIYLQLVLSITRWILEAKPGDSPPQYYYACANLSASPHHYSKLR